MSDKSQTEQKIEEAISDILYHTIYAAIRPEQMYTVDKLAKLLTASNRASRIDELERVNQVEVMGGLTPSGLNQSEYIKDRLAELRKLEP